MNEPKPACETAFYFNPYVKSGTQTTVGTDQASGSCSCRFFLINLLIKATSTVFLFTNRFQSTDFGFDEVVNSKQILIPTRTTEQTYTIKASCFDRNNPEYKFDDYLVIRALPSSGDIKKNLFIFLFKII